MGMKNVVVLGTIIRGTDKLSSNADVVNIITSAPMPVKGLEKLRQMKLNGENQNREVTLNAEVEVKVDATDYTDNSIAGITHSADGLSIKTENITCGSICIDLREEYDKLNRKVVVTIGQDSNDVLILLRHDTNINFEADEETELVFLNDGPEFTDQGREIAFSTREGKIVFCEVGPPTEAD